MGFGSLHDGRHESNKYLIERAYRTNGVLGKDLSNYGHRIEG
jgi:hypothetical protein